LTALDEKLLTRGEAPAPDADLLEPSYQASVRRYRQQAEDEHREQWIMFHSNMHQLHSLLAAEHREKAQALMRVREDSTPLALTNSGGLEADINGRHKA
jgi:hypothetical protein